MKSATFKEIRDSAMALRPSSRMKLVRELERSLGGKNLHDCPPGVLSDRDPHFMDEIERRINAYDRGEDKGVSWEKVRDKLGAKVNARKAIKRR